MGKSTVSIDEGFDSGSADGWVTFKLMVALFIIFLIVCSGAFGDTMGNWLGTEAIVNRTPTVYGTMIQGAALVAGFMTVVHLNNTGYI